MSLTDEHGARFLGRSWLKYFLFVLVAVVLLAAFLYVYAFVRVVPPISGTVVDAVTEKPVTGMNACLEVRLKQLNGAVLRTEVQQTDTQGRFFFWPSIHSLALLQEWDGYSSPCGEDLGPRLNEGRLRMGEQGEPSWSGYFPVTMVQTYLATLTMESSRRVIHSPIGMQIPLIPVMTKIEMCSQVRDSGLVKSCQELNAGVAAQRLRDPSPPRIAGLMRVSSGATDNDWERGGPHRFLAVYSRSVTGISPAVLLTEVYGDPDSARRTYEGRTTSVPGNLPESAAARDLVAGQKIRRIRGAQNEAFWISNNRLVVVKFLESSGADEAFLADCLSYFPSNL